MHNSITDTKVKEGVELPEWGKIPGHSSGRTQAPLFTTVPVGQKQPWTHISGQGLGPSFLFAHVVGQAVPHVSYTIPVGHTVGVGEGGVSGHWSAVRHLPSDSNIPLGQKQPWTHIAGQGLGGSFLFAHVAGQAEPHVSYTIPLAHAGGVTGHWSAV